MIATPPKPAAAPVMDEDAQAPAPTPAGADQSQTVEVPLSAVPGAKEGATVSFKVVSVDQQGGVVNLAPMTSDEGSEDMGGSDGMAEAFKPENTKGMA